MKGKAQITGYPVTCAIVGRGGRPAALRPVHRQSGPYSATASSSSGISPTAWPSPAVPYGHDVCLILHKRS